MNFPAEYQAPNIVSNDQMYIPVGMSVPVSMNAHSEMNITSRNGEVRTCSTIVTSTNSHLVTQVISSLIWIWLSNFSSRCNLLGSSILIHRNESQSRKSFTFCRNFFFVTVWKYDRKYDCIEMFH